MPCPSQMVEDEEEGRQANSARCWLLTPALLELLPAVTNGKRKKSKANGCLHGGRQYKGLT